MTQKSENENQSQKGNAVVIVLIALVIIAVGALAYLSGQMAGEQEDGANAEKPIAEEVAAAPEQPSIEVEPGNPVVATVDGNEITRVDAFNFIQTMAPAARQQLPIDQLFRLAQNQIVNTQVISKQVANVNLDNDPEVKKRLEAVKKNIVREVYLEKQVEAGVTEDLLQQAYAQYSKNFPEIPEVKARHILVNTEAEAKELLSKLKEGADFAELAAESSKDTGTAEKGGDLGFFAEGDVVPAFAKAAFALEEGAMTEEPVETEFGFHVIKVEKTRNRPVPEFEQAKPFLQNQLRQAVLDKLVRDWRAESEIEVFDINGKPIEPAAGEEAPAEEAQSAQ